MLRSSRYRAVANDNEAKAEDQKFWIQEFFYFSADTISLLSEKSPQDMPFISRANRLHVSDTLEYLHGSSRGSSEKSQSQSNHESAGRE